MDNFKQNFEKYKNKITEVLQEHGKLVIPVAGCILIVVIAIIVMSFSTQKKVDETVATQESQQEVETETILQEPLEKDSNAEVKALMASFYKALADGDLDTIKSMKDYTDDTELITYQVKSKYIESYDNLVCYTKNAMEEGSYFVYEYYDTRFFDMKDCTVPGLMTWYVYTNEEGKLVIDGDMDESVTASLKLATNTQDVVDLFNKVDAQYTETLDQNEELKTFMDNLRGEIKNTVGVELASLEKAESEETENAAEETEPESEAEQQEEATTVNEQVKATEKVNVRKSDSQEADSIGKAEKGLVMTRVEKKINGWSKVIFEGQEAYIKSDYLEVISSEPVETNEQAADTTTATGKKTPRTNVNVRNAPKESADAIGLAKAGQAYVVLEEVDGGWLKIEYNGQPGYAKSEFFQ